MLRRSVLTILMGLALPAAAGNFDYLPSSDARAKEFQNLMNSGNYRAALMTWNTSHGGTEFARSSSGHATLAYLLLQNGMPHSALELLFSNSNPSQLHPQLRKLWTVEIKNSSWVQKGWVLTRGGWKSIHNNDPITVKLSNRAQVKDAFKRADRLPKDHVNQKARIWWQIATRAPLINDVDSSLRALKLLKESGQTVIGADQISATQGRVLYQRGELAASLDAFEEVPKSSNLWVETLEERGWNALRGDDPDKAVGHSVTLLSPALAPLVGPESYFFSNLTSLKICDYPRIFKTSEKFKERHRARLASLEEFARTGTSNNFAQAFDRMDARGVNQEAVGPLVEWVPRAAFRDQKFLRYMETRRAMIGESKLASEFLGGALGSAPALERLVEKNRGQAERLKQLAYQRARTLAKAELKEYRQILNKMHIIEGEVIQRLAMDENLKGKRSQVAKVEDRGDVLVFPYSNDEVWFDELDNYKARVKDCPTLKGAGL